MHHTHLLNINMLRQPLAHSAVDFIANILLNEIDEGVKLHASGRFLYIKTAISSICQPYTKYLWFSSRLTVTVY